MITQEVLQALLIYDPVTGLFTNRVRRGNRAFVGEVAGYVNPMGYINIGLCKEYHLAHRLAWLYMHGEMPSLFIDHINGNPSDNRLSNLRLVDYKENAENQKLHSCNSSGFRGVHWNTKKQRWVAIVRHNLKIIGAGQFVKLEDAIAAVKAKRDRLFTHHRTEYSA